MVLITAFSLSSCFKEIDTEKLPPLETFTAQFNIKEMQSYYKIEENEVRLVKFNNPKAWDLGFETGTNGRRIIINYSAQAQIIDTEKEDINEVDENLAVELLNADNWKFDHQNGDPDSTAIDNWIESGNVFLLYRGAIFQNEVAYYKIFFESVNDNEYVFQYADIHENEIISKTIPKSNLTSFVTFSFTTGEIVELDPGKTEWDLLFTPYYGWYETLTPGYFLPYYMSGVYINYLNGVEVIKIDDYDTAFDSIDYSYVSQYEFSTKQDIIGQDWKLLPDPDNPFYYMDENKKYIVRAVNGNYYKLRFLNYYSNLGEQGYTTFEIKKL